MTTALSQIVLPGEDDLPCSDGIPMESEEHREQMILLIHTLALAWADRDDFHVGGNSFVYFSDEHIRKNDFRGPDVFVVLDTVRRTRKSWVVWKEGARTPNVVIELLSKSTAAVDRGEKMDVYARQLHVEEYYLFDPDDPAVLEGYRLQGRRYERMTPAANGDLHSAQLGLGLGVRRGIILGRERGWLRWLDGDGQVLPTHEERYLAARAELTAARTELATTRAELAAVRVELSDARAEARTFAERLEALERKLR